MKIKHGLIFLSILVIDQLTKWFIQSSMSLGESFDVVTGFFRITYLHNTGAAWSMLEGKMVFFYIISVIALIGMGLFYKHTKKTDYLTLVGLVCMMAGTVGNLIDRVAFHYVRDFLDFIILGYDFPVFNVADMALCFGVFLIVLEVFLESNGGFRK